jgi:hypothetical protein
VTTQFPADACKTCHARHAEKEQAQYELVRLTRRAISRPTAKLLAEIEQAKARRDERRREFDLHVAEHARNAAGAA